ERAEIGKRRHSREDAAGADQRLPRGELRVDAREGAEPAIRFHLVLGPARYVLRSVAKLRGLLDEEAIADERPAGFQARRERGEPFHVERVALALGPEGRIETVHAGFPPIARAPCLDDHQTR